MSDIIFQAIRTARLKHFNQFYNQIQKYKYFLIIDFEATCDQRLAFEPKEIIEFPCVVLNSHTLLKENQFHSYVKPKINPSLTDFCIELTGITQGTVSESDEFPKVFERFNDWILKNEYFTSQNKSIFVTHGDWDLRVMLPNQCAQLNIPVPDYFQHWIDVRKSFSQFTSHFPKGIEDICFRLKFEPQGRLHSGIADALNITEITRQLILRGMLFEKNNNLGFFQPKTNIDGMKLKKK